MTAPDSAKEPVAIIGLGCVLPDAPDAKTFWDNVLAGRSSIREVPRDRWDPALFFDTDKSAPDKTYTKIGGFVLNDAFNGLDYRMPPSTVAQIDPVQRWALSATRQAFKDAGYKTGLKGDEGKEFDRNRCAIILGNAMGGELQKETSRRVYWPEAAAAVRRRVARIVALILRARGLHVLRFAEPRRVLQDRRGRLAEAGFEALDGQLDVKRRGRAA